MVRGDSSVRVAITGDASGIQKASKDANKSVSGIGKAAKIAGAAIVAGFAADAVLEFTQTALAEGDRLADATTRLEQSLGNLSGPLIDSAEDFASLGQSAQDMLELEARIVDIGIASGITAGDLSSLADDAAATAAALALTTDVPADEWLDKIGKAAGGSVRPLKDLGIALTDAEVEARAMADTGKDNADALTEGELAAARFALILEKLQPRLADVATGSGDVEQRQAELQARWETLTGKIGTAIEGPLNDFLGWVLSGIDGLGMLDDLLGVIEQSFRDLLGPIARVADAIAGVLNAIDEALKGLGLIGGTSIRTTASGGRIVGSPSNVTVTVQGGSPEVVEQSVRNAVVSLSGKGPTSGSGI